MPTICGLLVSRRMATWHELKSVYSLEEALDIMEVLHVDSHNEHLRHEAFKRQARR